VRLLVVGAGRTRQAKEARIMAMIPKASDQVTVDGVGKAEAREALRLQPFAAVLVVGPLWTAAGVLSASLTVEGREAQRHLRGGYKAWWSQAEGMVASELLSVPDVTRTEGRAA
jgi:hypothetical protein